MKRKKEYFIMSQMLQKAFEAPPPQRKEEFLRKIKRMEAGQGKISHWRFVFMQASFIKKRIWALSLAVSAMALMGGYFVDENMVWFLSAMMPLLAISCVAENVRADLYGMTELEMSSRFCLKSILLARMSVIGILHLGVLCLASLMMRGDEFTILRIGVYLLVPYLLTDTAALWIIRKIRGREAFYAALCMAVIISILPISARNMVIRLYQSESFGGWLAALAVLCAAAASEWKKSIKRTEELTWNLL